MAAVRCSRGPVHGLPALVLFAVAAGIAPPGVAAQPGSGGAARLLAGHASVPGLLPSGMPLSRSMERPPTGQRFLSGLRAAARPPWRVPPGPPPSTVAGPAGPPGEGRAFVYSLAVPGLAQYHQGNRRWLLYAGTEILSAFLYLDARSGARNTRTVYRDFAWTRARQGVSAEPRRDGDFEYYETLSHWIASGAWDSDPARAGLQPESDRGTYNGWVWGLATEIFNVDALDPEASPGYGRALDYYRDRGYGPSLLWVWQGGAADQNDFRALIADSDRLAADARRALWILTANHLFSAIDGFITARLAATGPSRELGLVVTVPFR